MKKFVFFLLFSLILLTACSATSSEKKTTASSGQPLSTENITAYSKKQADIPTNTQLPTQTPLPTATPTVAPTKTELIPALNGTPMPIVSDEINMDNVKDIKVLKQSSSNRQSELLGADGSRWFTQKKDTIEIHDTKTNELIWEAKGSSYFNIDSNGNHVYFFDKDFTEIEIHNQDNSKETVKIPPFTRDTTTYFDVALSKKLLLIEPRAPWWYLEPSNDISVYSWGETTPKYTVKGNIAQFTIGEKYLTYLLGKTLVFSDLETGKKKTEFTIGEGEFNSIAYTGIQIWKTSWDDAFMAFSRNGNLEIWRLSDRKMVRSLQIQKDTVLDESQFDFSENNKSIMVLLPDGKIRTWQIESGEIIEEEETTEKSLIHRRVSDDGKIIKSDLPEVAHRAWDTEFSDSSSLAFNKDQETLTFFTQTIGSYPETSDLCEWNLSEVPSCIHREFSTGEAPANYQFFTLSKDNEHFFIKPLAKPVSLYEGWEKDGKLISQIPEISVKGYLNDFDYDSVTGIIKLKYSNGTTFLLNHKTKSRLLINGPSLENLVIDYDDPQFSLGTPKGLSDWFLISPDGNSLYGLVNNKKDLTKLEFVLYDSKTLKEVSRLPLDKTVNNLVVDKTVEDLTPRISSVILSPDGKSMISFINYASEKMKEESYKARLLIIPIDTPDQYSISELELSSGKTSNMLINEKGDMLIIGQTETGKLQFLEEATGKIIYTMNTGGNPVRLALRPDGKLIAIADREYGIQLIGIPAN